MVSTQSLNSLLWAFALLFAIATTFKQRRRIACGKKVRAVVISKEELGGMEAGPRRKCPTTRRRSVVRNVWQVILIVGDLELSPCIAGNRCEK